MTSEVAPGLAGGEAAFAELSQRHRRELHVHCYRMLASFDEAEDAVQETFLRAWRSRDSFSGGTMFRAWLYRIATNVCLDMLRSRSRRLTSPGPVPATWTNVPRGTVMSEPRTSRTRSGVRHAVPEFDSSVGDPAAPASAAMD